MTGFIDFLKAVALAGLCVLLLRAAQLCEETTRTERAIAAAAGELPTRIDTDLGTIRDGVLELTDKHLTRIEGTLNGALKTTDARLASIQLDANAQVTAANNTLQFTANAIADNSTMEFRAIADDVHQVAVPLAGITGQVNDAAPLFLDCQFNPDCAFNRFQGTSKAIERSAQAFAANADAIAGETTKIEQHVDRITAAAEKEADALTKPKRWYQRMEAWALLGGRAAIALF
jgi:hypothetical protein